MAEQYRLKRPARFIAAVLSAALALGMSPAFTEVAQPAYADDLAAEQVPVQSGSGKADLSASASDGGSERADGPELQTLSASEGEADEASPAGEDLSSASPQAPIVLDAKNLEDGSYTVSVELVQASNITKGSMAASAFDGIHGLQVLGGQYKLALSIGTVKVGTIVGYVKQLDYYPGYSIDGTQVKVAGDAVPCWVAAEKGDKGPASVPVPDNAKEQGLIPVKLYSDEMGGSQNAVLRIDWSSVKAGASDGASETQGTVVDRSMLRASLTAAAAALAKGGKTASATKALKRVVEDAKKVNSSASSTQAQVDAAKMALDKALATYKASKDKKAGSKAKSASKGKKSSSKKGFQVGRVYAVPLSFMKAGTSETSMANQYFGSTAIVRPLKNGKFDVRFSTSRSDYVTSISYKGSKLPTTSASGTEAEYQMTVSSTKSDASYRVVLDIKPMRELGGGPAEADLHLYFSQATDKGADQGQVASTANSGSSSGSSPSAPRALSTQAAGDGESFEVGQIYTVPAEFTKAGSDEKSMADQYFEDTAEVKPVDGGKYEVTITTNRSDYITEIEYDGEPLSAGAEDGNKRSYTMTVPASKSDAVYTLTMTVKPMQELGGGPADADLHLSFSQAVNKATGRPAGGSTIPKSGDSGKLIVVSLACMALAAAAMLLAGRRQYAANAA